MKLTWENFKTNLLYWFSRPVSMFFYERKENGVYEFSTKKFWMTAFCSLALYNDVQLLFFPAIHWSAKYAAVMVKYVGKAGAENIIIYVMGFLNSVAAVATGIYGWSKSKGAV